MSDKKRQFKYKHYPFGYSPQEIKKTAAAGLGFVPKEEEKDSVLELNMIEGLKKARKETEVKLGRPRTFQEGRDEDWAPAGS